MHEIGNLDDVLEFKITGAFKALKDKAIEAVARSGIANEVLLKVDHPVGFADQFQKVVFGAMVANDIREEDKVGGSDIVHVFGMDRVDANGSKPFG